MGQGQAEAADFVHVVIRNKREVANNHLPEHRVKIGSIELVRHPSSREFGPQESNEFLKIHLAVT